MISQFGLFDPLGTARVVTRLEDELKSMGYLVRSGGSLSEFSAVVRSCRDQAPSPFFDPDISELPSERVLWMSLSAGDGKLIGLQAFRLDVVMSNLAEWAPAYTIGLYMRRQEILVPMHALPPRNSIAERLRGRLVYHGELWLDDAYRKRRLSLWFGRLGLLLCLIKWQPDAIWALAAQSMAMNGGMLRLGYSHLERGFFRWQWASEGIDPVEWVATADRAALEQLVNEILTTPQQSLQA